MSSLNTGRTSNIVTDKIDDIINSYCQFLRVDRQATEGTFKVHRRFIREFLENIDKPLDSVTVEDIRTFLDKFSDFSPFVRANAVKAVRVFFRDFLDREDLIKTFKIPSLPFIPKELPSKQELQTFFQHLRHDKEKALFLMLASSGRRRNEILYLKFSDVDFDKRLIRPQPSGSRTKHTFISFYNSEAEEYLNRCINRRKLKPDSRLFDIKTSRLGFIFKRTSRDSGVRISPKVLRAWFASEMIRLGVSETYVDVFCGRLPKSVLGRHYLDLSTKRLKEIYDKADLRILSN